MYLNMYSSVQAGRTATYIGGTCLATVKYHELHVSRWTVVPGCPARVPRRHTLVRYGDPSECGQNPAPQPDSTSHLGPGFPRLGTLQRLWDPRRCPERVPRRRHVADNVHPRRAVRDLGLHPAAPDYAEGC